MNNLAKEMEWSAMTVLFMLALPSCGPREKGAECWENERKIIELTQRVKLGEYRLELSETGGRRDLDDLKSRLSEMDAALRALQSDRSALAAEISVMETRNTELGRGILERMRLGARGMEFETFSARDGRVFQNVVITMVNDSGVAFRHEHGAARLRYAELPDERRLFFGLEESAALAAEDRERRDALAYEHDIDLELDAIREREEITAALDEKNNAPRMLSSRLSVSTRPPEIRDLAQPAKPFGSGSSYRRYYNYSDYRSYRPVYRYVYRHPPAANPFCSSSRVHSKPSGYQSGACTPSPTNP